MNDDNREMSGDNGAMDIYICKMFVNIVRKDIYIVKMSAYVIRKIIYTAKMLAYIIKRLIYIAKMDVDNAKKQIAGIR